MTSSSSTSLAGTAVGAAAGATAAAGASTALIPAAGSTATPTLGGVAALTTTATAGPGLHTTPPVSATTGGGVSRITPGTATIIPQVIDDWEKWFSSRDSSDSINKEHQDSLFKLFDHSISADECRQRVLNHQEIVFLYRENFGSRRLNLFHHLKIQGGTVHKPSIDVGFIQSIEKDLSNFQKPDMSILFEKPSGPAIPIPTMPTLLAVTSEADIDALTNGASVSYQPRNFIPIAPFLCQAISECIGANEGDAKKVLERVVREIKNFDNIHNGDVSFTEKARSACKPILLWLYLVASENTCIKPIPTTSVSNKDLVKELKSVTEVCLINSTSLGHHTRPSSSSVGVSPHLSDQLKKPLEMIGTSIVTQQDFLRQLTTMQASSNEKSSKSFKKIPPKYQNMILVASSIGEVTETEPNEKAAQFFKSSSLLNANIFLNSLFEAEQLDCSVSNAVTNAFLHGSFLWSNALTPSGLAASVITTEDLLTTSSDLEQIYSYKRISYAYGIQGTTRSRQLLIST